MAKHGKSDVATVGHNSFEVTRFNAVKHAVLSRYTVLPWEDESEYEDLLDALIGEHKPEGPTETHMVEEIAGVMWRKRRLRLAEAAALRRGLEDTLAPYRETVKAALVHLDATDQSERVVDAIRATADQTAGDIREIEEDEAMTRQALDLLGSSRSHDYKAALAALREDTRNWWQEKLTWEPDDYEEGEAPYTTDAAGLLRFLETEVRRWYVTHRRELENRPLIREQAFGEALDTDKLERLGRYEVHLDRKLERILAMLLRLQDLRGAAANP